MKSFSINKYPNVLINEFPYSENPRLDMVRAKEPVETAHSYYKRMSKKPKFITNLGFFNMETGEPCFTLIEKGKVIRTSNYALVGIGITKDGKFKYGHFNDGNWDDFINGYPCLIEDGKKVKSSLGAEIDYGARRTVYGYGDNAIYSFLIEGNGMRFYQIQNMLLDKEGFKSESPDFDVKYAINVDGGGSTIALLNGKQVTDIRYNRAVDSFMTIDWDEPVIPTTKKYWRVQCSACPTKEEAIRIRDYIRKLPDPIRAGYHTAEVFFEYPWYKVQVGMYSTWNYAGAVRVKNDLKSKKIDSFIVYR